MKLKLTHIWFYTLFTERNTHGSSVSRPCRAKFVPNMTGTVNCPKKFICSFSIVITLQNAEQHLKEKGFSCKWDESGGLFFWQVLPAFRTHHETKERVWFNQADLHHTSYLKDSPMFVGQELPDHLYPYHTYYGDGSEIEPDTLQHIRATAWQNVVGFRWRNGDLLVIDNRAVQHGRISFTGPRKLLAVLTSNCKFNLKLVIGALFLIWFCLISIS